MSRREKEARKRATHAHRQSGAQRFLCCAFTLFREKRNIKFNSIVFDACVSVTLKLSHDWKETLSCIEIVALEIVNNYPTVISV